MNTLKTVEDPTTPYNPTTGRNYSGGNPAELVACGYDDLRWAGYGQWQKAGRQVMEGQKNTTLVRMVPAYDKKTGKPKLNKDGTPKLRKTSVRVFNWEQTEDKATADALRALAA